MRKVLLIAITANRLFSRRLQTIKSWQINGFSPQLSSILFLNEHAKCAYIRRPNDVVLKVFAASVNPIDVYMCEGYGHRLLQCMSLMSELRFPNVTYDRFPLTLGRDFSGVIVDKGESVNKYNVGDHVWGVTAAHEAGTHSEYICVPQFNISKKPTNMSHVDAASLPYASLTAWSALCTFGGINSTNAFGKRVLVLGGTGGVGTVAIQLLKAWGAFVVTTCSPDACEWITKVTNVDECVDYKTNDMMPFRKSFDLVLDVAKRGDVSESIEDSTLLTLKKNGCYVTLNSPLLKSFDKHGLFAGSATALCQATFDTVKGSREGVSVRWAFFYPSSAALQSIKDLVEKGELRAVVDEVYKFDQLPNGYIKVKSGHARGKTVIQVSE